MNTLTIRGVTLGAGRAKIIVPLVGATRAEVLAQAAALRETPPDLVEWRADFCEGLCDEAALTGTARALREALGALPLLFTLRTKREGGQAEIDAETYLSCSLAVARSGCVDLIDAELSAGEETLRALIDGAHAAGCPVVGSRHDFSATPPRAEMVSFLRAAQSCGADIPKLAVMPRCDADVLELLCASAEFRAQYAERPFVTISMGARGAVSRVACALSGSCMTFASAGQSSAPGQLPAAELARILDLLSDQS